MSNLIRVVDLCKSYYEGLTELAVLNGVDLEVQTGEILAIIGASGVGKSTLLHLLGGLDRPTRGEIFYEDQDIFKLNDKRLDRFRNREVGFVFSIHQLLGEFTALENVAMAALISGEKLGRRIWSSRGVVELCWFGQSASALSESALWRRAPKSCNCPRGYQPTQSRVSDEPTGNLDRKTSEAVLDLLWDLNKRLGQTLIVVTHNREIAKRADRHINLVDGKVSN